jgi:hypothetical protein
MTRVGVLRERANILRTLAQSFDSPTLRADLLVLAKRCEEPAHAAEHKTQIGNYVARLVVLASMVAAAVPLDRLWLRTRRRSPHSPPARKPCRTWTKSPAGIGASKARASGAASAAAATGVGRRDDHWAQAARLADPATGGCGPSGTGTRSRLHHCPLPQLAADNLVSATTQARL